MDLTIVIPCYNEADNVAQIRARLLPASAELAAEREVEILFVDDGSTDRTWPALRDTFGEPNPPRVDVRFLRHDVNRGLGAALRSGVAAARGAVVVTADSDGTYEFSEIARLLARLTPDVDVVTASVFCPGGRIAGVPAHRVVLSRGVSLLYRLLVRRTPHTYTCLFRAYRREVLARVAWESDDFLGVTELLVRAMLMGYRVAEIPATLRPRTHGASKARLARTALAHLRFQSRIVLHRLHAVSLVERREARRDQGVA
jgi:dolichol-phosphate mannosyltransferase